MNRHWSIGLGLALLVSQTADAKPRGTSEVEPSQLEQVLTAAGWIMTPERSSTYTVGDIYNRTTNTPVAFRADCFDAEPREGVYTSYEVVQAMKAGAKIPLGIARFKAAGMKYKKLQFAEPYMTEIADMHLIPNATCANYLRTLETGVSDLFVIKAVLSAEVKEQICTTLEGAVGVRGVAGVEGSGQQQCDQASEGHVAVAYKIKPIAKLLKQQAAMVAPARRVAAPPVTAPPVAAAAVAQPRTPPVSTRSPATKPRIDPKVRAQNVYNATLAKLLREGRTGRCQTNPQAAELFFESNATKSVVRRAYAGFLGACTDRIKDAWLMQEELDKKKLSSPEDKPAKAVLRSRTTEVKITIAKGPAVPDAIDSQLRVFASGDVLLRKKTPLKYEILMGSKPTTITLGHASERFKAVQAQAKPKPGGTIYVGMDIPLSEVVVDVQPVEVRSSLTVTYTDAVKKSKVAIKPNSKGELRALVRSGPLSLDITSTLPNVLPKSYKLKLNPGQRLQHKASLSTVDAAVVEVGSFAKEFAMELTLTEPDGSKRTVAPTAGKPISAFEGPASWTVMGPFAEGPTSFANSDAEIKLDFNLKSPSTKLPLPSGVLFSLDGTPVYQRLHLPDQRAQAQYTIPIPGEADLTFAVSGGKLEAGTYVRTNFKSDNVPALTTYKTWKRDAMQAKLYSGGTGVAATATITAAILSISNKSRAEDNATQAIQLSGAASAGEYEELKALAESQTNASNTYTAAAIGAAVVSAGLGYLFYTKHKKAKASKKRFEEARQTPFAAAK